MLIDRNAHQKHSVLRRVLHSGQKQDSINRSQRFPATPEADTYTHVQDKSNPYYDIFFRMDTERKTIVFALGERKKEISVTVPSSSSSFLGFQ